MIDQYNSLAEKFLKKGFWLYLFSFILAPMGYIIKIILSGELTVSEIGILYGIISLVTLLSAYNDLGMSESINHFIPKFVTEKRYDKVKTTLVFAFIAQMTTGITIALGFYFGADWLALHYFKSQDAIGILKIFAFYFLGINIMQVLSMFFMSVQNTFAHKLTGLIRMFFILLITLFIFFGNYGSIIHYTYAWIGGLYLGIIIAIGIFYKKYVNKYFRYEKILWEKEMFITIFKYGLLVFLGASVGTILSQIDMQMIIFMLGTTDAGYYTNYLSIIGIPFMIIGPIFGLLFPLFSEMHSKGENSKITQVKEIFTNNFLIVGIAFNFFLFTFALPIAYILFGEKFLNSGMILQYSILFLTFNFLMQINFNILAGVGRVKERLKIISIALIINIIINIYFINLIGVAGAALASGIGWMIIWIMSEYIIRGEYKIKISWFNIFKNITLLGFISIFIIYNYKDFSSFIISYSRGELFWFLLILAIVYFGFFVSINYKMFKLCILEIKKIKK